MGEKFYLTTAIPYVNANPHLGHALEFVQADVIAGYRRLKGYDVFLATGSDENSLKSVQAAAKQKITTQALCDVNSAAFRKLAEKIGLTYDAFVRSSDKEVHWKGVEKLWNLCLESGDIYKKVYTGLYCVGCEAFYTENELVNGLCPEHLKPPETVNEENYFFRLSKYERKLRKLIESDELMITPDTRKNEILNFIDQGLEDFSVSRSIERSKDWGIPVPGDSSQMIYVWFDALSVYLTSAGFGRSDEQFSRLWPADMHVIGKGIVRFHAIYWPAMLMSAGLALPKEIMIHGYITSGGQKMSKSLGNVIDPMHMLEKYGQDSVRYYLSRNIPTFEDGDFSEKELINISNSELVGNLGNFIHRTLTFIHNNYGGIVKADSLDGADMLMLEKIDALAKEIDASLSETDLCNGLAKVLSISTMGNKYFQDNKPWECVTKDRDRCEKTLFVCANICRALCVLIRPYLPNASERLSQYLGFKANSLDDAKTLPKGTIRIGNPQPLFKKIEEKASAGK